MKMIVTTFFGSRPSIVQQLVRGDILAVHAYAIEAWGFRLEVISITQPLGSYHLTVQYLDRRTTTLFITF